MVASQPIIYVNGGFVPQSEARISVLDHAVLYGDGVFDTVVAWNDAIFELDAHIDRFYRSLKAIALECPVSRGELVELLCEAVRRNRLSNAYIKWIVTRGSNGTPLMDPAGCVPNLIILVLPYVHRFDDARLARGLKLKTAAVRRPPGQVLDPHVKSLNYLNLVMAKLEAKAAGADEALLLDMNGRLCEAPGYNVFVVQGRKLRTPAHERRADAVQHGRRRPASGRDRRTADRHRRARAGVQSPGQGLPGAPRQRDAINADRQSGHVWSALRKAKLRWLPPVLRMSAPGQLFAWRR
jgi:branched-chain amino acid aminotransferase